jgi:hypothetical protein
MIDNPPKGALWDDQNDREPMLITAVAWPLSRLCCDIHHGEGLTDEGFVRSPVVVRFLGWRPSKMAADRCPRRFLRFWK